MDSERWIKRAAQFLQQKSFAEVRQPRLPLSVAYLWSETWAFLHFLLSTQFCLCLQTVHSLGESSTDIRASHDRPFSASRRRITLEALLNLRHGSTSKKEGLAGPRTTSMAFVRTSKRLSRSSLRYSYLPTLPTATRNLGDISRPQVRIYLTREHPSNETDGRFRALEVPRASAQSCCIV